MSTENPVVLEPNEAVTALEQAVVAQRAAATTHDNNITTVKHMTQQLTMAESAYVRAPTSKNSALMVERTVCLTEMVRIAERSGEALAVCQEALGKARTDVVTHYRRQDLSTQ